VKIRPEYQRPERPHQRPTSSNSSKGSPVPPSTARR